MESFEAIQQKEEAHLLGELGTLGRRLVELGWSRERVIAYVEKVFNESMNTAAGDPTASRTEADR